MTTSLLTKLSVAAAATMLTFSPALAHKSGSHNHGHGYYQSYGKSAYSNYKKRKHARHYHRYHRFHAHRHLKPKFYFGWTYGRGW